MMHRCPFFSDVKGNNFNSYILRKFETQVDILRSRNGHFSEFQGSNSCFKSHIKPTYVLYIQCKNNGNNRLIAVVSYQRLIKLAKEFKLTVWFFSKQQGCCSHQQTTKTHLHISYQPWKLKNVHSVLVFNSLGSQLLKSLSVRYYYERWFKSIELQLACFFV